MAKKNVMTEYEFERWTRNYPSDKREALRKKWLADGRLVIDDFKDSAERKAYQVENAIYGEVVEELENEEKRKEQEAKKPQEMKSILPKVKLSADVVTRKISKSEFDMLFSNLTDEERREVRTNLILDGKYDPDNDPKFERVEPMSDAEIEAIAADIW